MIPGTTLFYICRRAPRQKRFFLSKYTFCVCRKVHELCSLTSLVFISKHSRYLSIKTFRPFRMQAFFASLLCAEAELVWSANRDTKSSKQSESTLSPPQFIGYSYVLLMERNTLPQSTKASSQTRKMVRYFVHGTVVQKGGKLIQINFPASSLLNSKWKYSFTGNGWCAPREARNTQSWGRDRMLTESITGEDSARKFAHLWKPRGM